MLRDYQIKWKADVYEAWATGARNVMGIAPTGAGKTVMLGDILRELGQPSCIIAHRQELVGQLALAMNREEVPHAIIAPKEVIRQVVALEMDTHGKTYFNARAPVRVAGVNTLTIRDAADRWFSQVQFVVIDEGHHVLRENIWGKAMGLFPAARGLFPTAHALRADGAGLGRHADGLVDRIVLGPACRTLIDRGYLTDYRLVCPESDIDVSDVPISSTGDYSAPKLREAIHKSKTIVGDVADHYLKFAPGKLGITFAVDVEAATEIAAAYRSRGVPAEVITAKTPIAVRGQLMRKFRNREILQLVNVDVLGEGVDVPAIEVVSMARHTASFQLYSQQFGRALRTKTGFESQWDTWTDDARKIAIAASVKPHAIIIDHVNNYQRHGLPDKPRQYTLDRRERKARNAPDDAIPLRNCTNPDCLQPYERVLPACPYCGTVPPVSRRGTPEHVEGDLIELDPEALKALRGEIAKIDGTARIPVGLAGTPAETAIYRKHAERQRAQITLRASIALWAGWQKHQGRGDSETYKRFFHAFRVDVATAQTLGAKEAAELEAAVKLELDKHKVIAA
jgi:DNA repair protein RadD